MSSGCSAPKLMVLYYSMVRAIFIMSISQSKSKQKSPRIRHQTHPHHGFTKLVSMYGISPGELFSEILAKTRQSCKLVYLIWSQGDWNNQTLISVETVSDFIFWGSKITANGDCSHEIKRRLLLGRKVMTNLNSIFKSRDITLPTKVCLVKAMVFPVVMYGCES